jgi:hypothetical protein
MSTSFAPKGLHELALVMAVRDKQLLGSRVLGRYSMEKAGGRASRSARIAAVMAWRSSFPGSMRKPSFVLTERTTGTSFSTNSTNRMLPSGCRSAENAFLGLKSRLQAKRPFSSATNFMMV